MLFRRLLLGVVRNVELHELVEAPEPVAKGGILDALFVGDDEVVQGKQGLHAVDEEVPVAGDAADGVAEERQMHYLWQGDERLDVAPIAYAIVMEI